MAQDVPVKGGVGVGEVGWGRGKGKMEG
jgi:hypothetical protein